nr:hypothetical protein [Actinomyces wuliandei]
MEKATSGIAAGDSAMTSPPRAVVLLQASMLAPAALTTASYFLVICSGPPEW